MPISLLIFLLPLVQRHKYIFLMQVLNSLISLVSSVLQMERMT